MPAIRQGVIYLTIFGMDLCCLYTTLLLANRSVNDRLSIAGLLVILLFSFAIFKTLRRFLRFAKLVDLICWLIVWPLITLAILKIQLFGSTPINDPVWLGSIPQALGLIFTSLEPSLLLIICSAMLWWLGRRLAGMKPGFSATVSEFQFGFIFLLLTYFIGYGLNAKNPTAVPVTLIFFTCGLTGISISNEEAGRGWFNSLKQWHWSVMLLVSIGVILSAGLIVSIIVSPDFLQLILRLLAWLWGLVESVLRWLASLIPPSSEAVPPLPGLSPPPEQPPDSEMFHFPELILGILRIVWTVMVIGLVLVAIWRISSSIFDWLRRRTGGSGGESESLKVNPWQDLAKWLKNLLLRLFRIKRKRMDLKETGITSEAAAVRQIYAHWLRRMGSAGFPRRKDQTPLEYRSAVEDLLITQKKVINELTGKYIEVRYGAAVPTLQEIENLKEQWTILKKVDLKHKNEVKIPGSNADGNSNQARSGRRS